MKILKDLGFAIGMVGAMGIPVLMVGGIMYGGFWLVDRFTKKRTALGEDWDPNEVWGKEYETEESLAQGNPRGDGWS